MTKSAGQKLYEANADPASNAYAFIGSESQATWEAMAERAAAAQSGADTKTKSLGRIAHEQYNLYSGPRDSRMWDAISQAVAAEVREQIAQEWYGITDVVGLDIGQAIRKQGQEP